MATLTFSARALADLERLASFLAHVEQEASVDVAGAIVRALAALATSPFLGRPADEGLRELVMSRGRTGYVALYRYVATRDEVRVLRIRHQREAPFSELDD